MNALIPTFDQSELATGDWLDRIHNTIELATGSESGCAELELTMSVSSWENIESWNRMWGSLVEEYGSKQLNSWSMVARGSKLVVEFTSSYVWESADLLQTLVRWPLIFRGIEAVTSIEVRGA